MPNASLYRVLDINNDASSDEIKHAYRTLAKKYHPDNNPGDKRAEERFKEIASAYAILGDTKKRAQYDKAGIITSGPVIITTRKGRYALQNQPEFAGDVADIYAAVLQNTGEQFAFKIARSHRDNDLLENEAKVLKEIYPADVTNHKYHLYLPKLIETLKVDDGSRRQVNILEWLHNYHSLEKVRAAHSRLAMEHSVWMFNRTLEILGYVHNQKGYVHGAVIPPHILVYAGDKEKDPFNHGARLVGWSYSVPVGKRVESISSSYENFYPPEVLNKKPVSAATDIYMAAKSVIHVLGGKVTATGADRYPAHIPDYLINFLRSCTIKTQASRPQDAWALHKELKDHMRKYYGPKKYIPFSMPLPT